MISLRQVVAPESVDVDFNEYVPLTITWSSASSVLQPPRYVELQGENGYLELKFHPSSGILIEVVLAAASEIQVEQTNLAPENSKDANLMPFLDPGDTVRETGESPVVKAYSDYLCVSFGPDPDHWVGSDPVLFGLTGEQSLTAICTRWTSSERESVLTGRLELVLRGAFGEFLVAGDGGREGEEGQEVAGVAFVAQGQPPAAGQPGQGSLDDPAVPAQPVAGLDALAGDAGGDAAATPSLRWRGETSHPWLDDDHLVHDHVSGAPAGPAFSGTLVHEGHTNAFSGILVHEEHTNQRAAKLACTPVVLVVS